MFWYQFGTIVLRFGWHWATFLVPFHGICAWPWSGLASYAQCSLNHTPLSVRLSVSPSVCVCVFMNVCVCVSACACLRARVSKGSWVLEWIVFRFCCLEILALVYTLDCFGRSPRESISVPVRVSVLWCCDVCNCVCVCMCPRLCVFARTCQKRVKYKNGLLFGFVAWKYTVYP